MSTAIADVRDGIELRGSGAIRVWIEDTEYPIRRPRVREFRRLREALEEVMDDITAMSDDVQKRQIALNDEIDKRAQGGGEPATLEERHTVRQMGRDLTARREELLLRWWSEVGTTLLDSRTLSWPEADEMPAWMGATESATELVTHWRSVPSLSGAR